MHLKKIKKVYDKWIGGRTDKKKKVIHIIIQLQDQNDNTN